MNKSEIIAGVCLVLFVALFFGRILYNGFKHSEYVELFESECRASGGVMFLPSGVKGWPQPECRNPDSIIAITSKVVMRAEQE